MPRNLTQFDALKTALNNRIKRDSVQYVQGMVIQSIGFNTLLNHLRNDLILWNSDFKRDDAELATKIQSGFDLLFSMLDDEGTTK